MTPAVLELLWQLREKEARATADGGARTTVLELRDGCCLVLQVGRDGIARQRGLPGGDQMVREQLHELLNDHHKAWS